MGLTTNYSALGSGLDKSKLYDRLRVKNTNSLSLDEVDSLVTHWSAVFAACVELEEIIDTAPPLALKLFPVTPMGILELKKRSMREITFYSDLSLLMKIPVQVEAPF